MQKNKVKYDNLQLFQHMLGMCGVKFDITDKEIAEAKKRMGKDVENSKKNNIIVRDNFHGAHQLIKDLREDFKTAYTDFRCGYRFCRNLNTMPIDVTKNLACRALFIGDAFIKEIIRKGYFCEEYPCHVIINGENVFYAIEEPYKVKKIKASKNSTREREYYGSGILRLRITNPSRNCRASFIDGKNNKVEDYLGEFIEAMEISADTEVERKLKLIRDREESKRIKEEKQEAYRDAMSVFHNEEYKVSSLISDAKDWKKSALIREYLEAFVKEGNLDSANEAWITWAYQQADRLDPLKDSPHSILDEPRPQMPKGW